MIIKYKRGSIWNTKENNKVLVISSDINNSNNDMVTIIELSKNKAAIKISDDLFANVFKIFPCGINYLQEYLGCVDYSTLKYLNSVISAHLGLGSFVDELKTDYKSSHLHKTEDLKIDEVPKTKTTEIKETKTLTLDDVEAFSKKVAEENSLEESLKALEEKWPNKHKSKTDIIIDKALEGKYSDKHKSKADIIDKATGYRNYKASQHYQEPEKTPVLHMSIEEIENKIATCETKPRVLSREVNHYSNKNEVHTFAGHQFTDADIHFLIKYKHISWRYCLMEKYQIWDLKVMARILDQATQYNRKHNLFNPKYKDLIKSETYWGPVIEYRKKKKDN